VDSAVGVALSPVGCGVPGGSESGNTPQAFNAVKRARMLNSFMEVDFMME
jgi:hypothetical protein